MHVHLIVDTKARLSVLSGLLQERYALTTTMLPDLNLPGKATDAVIVAVDLRDASTIAVLKQLYRKLARISKRIFLADPGSRLALVQAYALGATTVLPQSPTSQQLLSKLEDGRAPLATSNGARPDLCEIASDGASCIAGMFSSVLSGTMIDVDQAKEAGRRIADSIAENGLSHWLSTVRRHHEGTYQHCLLVTGITIDFGLTLGVPNADLQRLYVAAMFHDVGKATIPLAVLDKPGKLDGHERELIASHPLAGYDALKSNVDISAETLDAVRHHHEFLDGSGYPDGLSGNNISDLTRMLTISDIFSALIEQRSYKPTMPRDRAYEILQGMHDKLEKPLVNAFRRVALAN